MNLVFVDSLSTVFSVDVLVAPILASVLRKAYKWQNKIEYFPDAHPHPTRVPKTRRKR